jgi:hypothetical protein
MQLGDGSTTDRTTPIQVSGLSDVVAVAGGAGHSLAVLADGTVWAWGLNNYGQLGDGTTTHRTTPVQVSSLTGVVTIACGGNHTLALKSDGTVYAWGYNTNGQLGDGTTTNRYTPAQVSSLTGVVSVACGYYHTLALKSDGTVYAWGRNSYGQLGDGTTTQRTTPVQVQGGPINVSTNTDLTTLTSRFVNFTGQHRCFLENMQNLADIEGLVVVADKNRYLTPSTAGLDAMNVNDCLPVVSLSTKKNDPRVFGVLSLSFNSMNDRFSEAEKTELLRIGDIRVQVNSVGEGGIWITDEGGPLSAGDFLSSASTLGYATRQSDDVIRNYTIAKITMDCDFNPTMVPKQRVKYDPVTSTTLIGANGMPVLETETIAVTTPHYFKRVPEVLQEITKEQYDIEVNNDPESVRSSSGAQTIKTYYKITQERVTEEITAE